MDFVPALRGRIGDWEYYTTIMKLNDVATRINFAHELHKHKELDQVIQRELSDRVKDMVRYLVNQRQHFYGAIIVAVYGGNPKFEPVRVSEHRLLDDIAMPFGVIVFDGSQQYFALDGQHRLASIKEAIEQNRELSKEELVVIFVPHYETTEGLERTRRLFTALNRYAKPTSSDVNVAMDEDDAVAINTRRLVREHPLFSAEGRIKVQGKNIAEREDDPLTTLVVLYDVNQNLLMKKDRDVKGKEFKQFRPNVEELDGLYNELCSVWDAVAENIKPFQMVANGQVKPGFLRRGGEEIGTGQGSLLMRPVGQMAMSLSIRWALDEGLDLHVIMKRLNAINWELNSAPWKGTVWRAEKMQTSKNIQQLTARLMGYMIGLDEDGESLLLDYRKELEEENAHLPGKVA